jgi:hypothetical protein
LNQLFSLPKVTEQITNIIANNYPELQSVFSTESLAIDIVDFVYLIHKLFKESMQKDFFDTRPLKIVFILQC